MDWLVNFGPVCSILIRAATSITAPLRTLQRIRQIVIYVAATRRFSMNGLAIRLRRKLADIKIYIGSIEQFDTATLIDAWLRLTPYKYLVPASIQGPERQNTSQISKSFWVS